MTTTGRRRRAIRRKSKGRRSSSADARAKNRAMYFGSAGVLGDTPAREEQGEAYVANPTLGALAGLWDPMGLGVGMPLDQNEDDLRSLTYTSEPLRENLEISGAPQAT